MKSRPYFVVIATLCDFHRAFFIKWDIQGPPPPPSSTLYIFIWTLMVSLKLLKMNCREWFCSTTHETAVTIRDDRGTNVSTYDGSFVRMLMRVHHRQDRHVGDNGSGPRDMNMIGCSSWRVCTAFVFCSCVFAGFISAYAFAEWVHGTENSAEDFFFFFFYREKKTLDYIN